LDHAVLLLIHESGERSTSAVQQSNAEVELSSSEKWKEETGINQFTNVARDAL